MTWLEEWRLRGLPRCREYFIETGTFCGRLIWPWHEAVGPVDLIHARCKRRADAEFVRSGE